MRRLCHALVLTTALVTATVAGCARFGSDSPTLLEAEPNETAANATTNGAIDANRTLAGSAEQGGLDVFRIALPADANLLEIEFSRDGEDAANIELALTDNTDAVISTSASLPVTLARDTFAVTVTSLTEVFLRLRFGIAPNGTTSIGYAFVWRAVTFDQTHEPDDINVDADARGALAENTSVAAECQQGDDDRYRLTAASGQAVNVVVTFSFTAGNINFSVHDGAGPPLVTKSEPTDNEVLEDFVLTGTGPFYVRVFVSGAATTVPYTIYWQVVG